MPAGRPPKPLERKRLTGRTPGTDSGGRPLPVLHGTIVKEIDVPRAPTGLKTRGKREWVNIWTAGQAWLAPQQDYAWVEMIARAWDDITAFRAKIEEDGLIQQGSMGQVIAHPLIAEVRKAEQTIARSLSILGFSPSDRARLGLAEVKRQNALLDMMAKANSG
jgi:P27 family predicted phage terminase small subunit